jgi:hypothetical protein
MKTYHAVSILAAARCCEAAEAVRSRKFLSKEAPALPLAECTKPAECKCRFQKHDDRRTGDDDRRLLGSSQRSVWYGGQEKRGTRGRRSGEK